MNTSQTGFLSEILAGGKIPPAKLAYFRERLRNRLHQFVLREFMARQQEGITQADVARALGRRPEQINRWLGNPGNWELDSVSDLMLAISKSELDFKTEPLEAGMTIEQAIWQLAECAEETRRSLDSFLRHVS